MILKMIKESQRRHTSGEGVYNTGNVQEWMADGKTGENGEFKSRIT